MRTREKGIRLWGGGFQGRRWSGGAKTRRCGLFAGVNVRVQHADEGQIAITLGKIEAITDNEYIRDFEADVVRLDRLKPAGGFIEQHAGADTARTQVVEAS